MSGADRMHKNYDSATVEGFGDEWVRFDQSPVAGSELREIFDQYFRLFPWEAIAADAAGMDVGCGSGRWAKLIAPRVGVLHCIDASDAALGVARRNLEGYANCRFVHASVDEIPLPDSSLDFGYSLGVLHHAPDTSAAIRSCSAKLKPGAPFLLYLYYALDNRSFLFRLCWKVSDLVRRAVSNAPHRVRYWISQIIVALVYWPLARMARLLERAGADVSGFPLSGYRNRSFYIMRNDALDRFGTVLEQRFTATEIKRMMAEAGLERIRVGDQFPYWCAIGYRKSAQ